MSRCPAQSLCRDHVFTILLKESGWKWWKGTRRQKWTIRREQNVECSNISSVAGCACVTCGGVVRHLLTDYDGELRRPRAPTLLCYRHTSSHPVPSQRAAQSSFSHRTLFSSILKGLRIEPTKPLQSVWTLGYSVTEVLRRVKRCMTR